jgi:hypothetical protein
VFGRNSASFQKRFLPRLKRTLLDQQEDSFPPNVTITKPFSGPKAIGEDKELIQKSKGRRKNMPRAQERAKRKAVFWRKIKRDFIYKNQKNYKLKDQNQK